MPRKPTTTKKPVYTQDKKGKLVAAKEAPKVKRETIAQVKAQAERDVDRLRVRAMEAERQLRRAKEDLREQIRRADRNLTATIAADQRVRNREIRVVELENERKRLRRRLLTLEKKAKPKLPREAARLIEALPDNLPDVLYTCLPEILTDGSMRDVTMALVERGGMEPVRMLLAGVGMNPQARRFVNEKLDTSWGSKVVPSLNTVTVPVILGGGVHAAIFASIYSQATGNKPTVVTEGRVGGVFAVTEGPSFFLNSRNRPGPLSVPGDEFGALNVLPGAPVQPSDIGGSEYLTNDALAWSVRMALMLHADVYTVDKVARCFRYSNALGAFEYDNARIAYARNIVVATGLSNPNKAFAIDNDRYLTFQQFMGRLDLMFPFQGMRRVAVVGAGDSGKTVVEALTGQGPSTRYSVPSLDFVEKIDWYGVPEDRRTRTEWEGCNRSRYKGIGRLLPQDDKPFRVLPLPKPSFADVGFECVKVDGMPYDYVIDCTGYRNDFSGVASWAELRDTEGGGRLIARTLDGELRQARSNMLVIGPAAKLPTERTDEAVLKGIGENATSIFQYADRTARVAEVYAKKVK